jgi:hypothetical protein
MIFKKQTPPLPLPLKGGELLRILPPKGTPLLNPALTGRGRGGVCKIIPSYLLIITKYKFRKYENAQPTAP